jgi:predicted naringenin-chalcone synthase
MASNAYINKIATAVPAYEVHRTFIRIGASMLADQPRQRAVFNRMANASGIERRYSCLEPAKNPYARVIDVAGNFVRGAFPGTALRMKVYEQAAPALAGIAVEKLLAGEDRSRITHLIVTSCTGFSAPGIDLALVALCGLSRSVERTIIGFMGCYAAMNALKMARHIVRSDPDARVLVVNVELCTLHLMESTSLEKLLSFCLWGDGCAASLVTSEPKGLRLDRFFVLVDSDSQELMSWRIDDTGFDMVLSGKVPAAIQRSLADNQGDVLDGKRIDQIDLWAVHPGGRSILDAVQRALALEPKALAISREVLRLNGNMSSPTVMFVLERMLDAPPGLNGCGMAFGPGLTAETMTFRTV